MSRFQSDEPVFPAPRAPAEAGTPDLERDCPHCQGQGWYTVADRATGDPAQEQCEFCLATGKLYVNLRGAASPSAGPSPEPPLGVTHWQDVAAGVLRAHHPSYDVDCRETLCACGMRFKAGEEPSWERHAALFVLKALPRVPAISGPGPSPTAAAPLRGARSTANSDHPDYERVCGELEVFEAAFAQLEDLAREPNDFDPDMPFGGVWQDLVMRFIGVTKHARAALGGSVRG